MNKTDAKSVLITGGSGFVGTAVRNKLSNFDYKIRTIGRSQKEDICLDLGDAGLLDVIQDFLPDIVCHFASGSNIARAEENKDKETADTVAATKNLLNALNKVNPKAKILYLSSQAVYGHPSYLPVDEKHPVQPFNFYGKNKLRAEELITKSSLDYLIMRVSSVFGKGQDYKKSGVVAKFINKMRNNESPLVFNSAELLCDFIYVDDLSNAVLKVIQADHFPRDIVNLGSGIAVTLQNVLDELYKYFPSAPKPIIQTNDLYVNENYKGIYFDVSKLQQDVNWSIEYNIEKGLKHMLGNLSRV